MPLVLVLVPLRVILLLRLLPLLPPLLPASARVLVRRLARWSRCQLTAVCGGAAVSPGRRR
jgi:hypothetical protein